MKARKLISCALALILIFSTLPVFTVSQAIYNSERIGDWKIQKHSYTKSYGIVRYYGKDKTVTIPKKIGGKSIKRIENSAFANTNITSVYIPKTITYVYGAFRNCKKLTKVTFEKGSTLNELTYAFDGCSSLKSITLPDSVVKLSYGAFRNCTSLTTVKAKKLSSIGNETFRGCKGLKTFNFSNITHIGQQAFTGCTGLTQVSLPKVTSIYLYAFSKCSSLKKVTLSKDLKSINIGVFKDCSSLKEITFDGENKKYAIYDGALCSKDKKEIIAYPAGRADDDFIIPSETQTVRKYAFYKAKNLNADLTFSENIASIGDYAFAGCGLIEKISVPDTVDFIGKFAFRNTAYMKAQKGNGAYYVSNILVRLSGDHDNYDIKDGTVMILSDALDKSNVGTLTIPESVEKFQKNALRGTGTIDTLIIDTDISDLTDIGLEKVYYYNSSTKIQESKIKNVVINYPITALISGNNSSYQQFSNIFSCTSIESIILPDSVARIGDYAFQRCRNLKTFTTPKHLTSLGNSCFVGTQIESFEWPETMTIIPNGCFAGTQLKNFEIPNTVTEIGDAAFSGTNITEIAIPDSVTKIGSNAFNSTNIKEIVIPDSVTEIGHDIFEYCKKLESVTLSKNITKIPSYAFRACTSLKEIEIPQGVTSIKNKAFKGSGLVSVVIPDSVTELGSNIFTNCTSLEYVKLPENNTLNSTGVGMFSYSSLEKLTIPETYTKIDNNAFKESKIKNVVIPDTVTVIGSCAFYNCKNLKELELPESLAVLGTNNESAFRGSGLESIEIPSGIKTLNKNMFKNCKSLTEVVLPDSIRRIEYSAFYGCTSLSKIDLGDSLEEIGDRAFYGCKNLKSIKLPNSLVRIGKQDLQKEVFMNTGLKNITIPKGVDDISVRMFKGCKNLTKATFKGYVEDMHYGTFTDCKNLKTVVFEKGTADISTAFNNCTALEKIYIKKGTVKDIRKNAFKGAKSGIKFYVNTKAQAKTLKGALEKTNIKSAKIYANNVLVYKNVG